MAFEPGNFLGDIRFIGIQENLFKESFIVGIDRKVFGGYFFDEFLFQCGRYSGGERFDFFEELF